MTLSNNKNLDVTKSIAQSSYSLKVNDESAGQRLDKFINQNLDSLSRTRIKNLMEGGYVFDAKTESPLTDPSKKVKAGERYYLFEPKAVSAEPEAENIALDIVFEDEHLIIINKPAGMVVHPANGHEGGTLVNALLYHAKDSLSGIGGVKRPGIVHRIDKDTSGLLVVAKNDQAHKGLSVLFHDHHIERNYTAFVKGKIQPPFGKVEGNIARHPNNRKKMAVSKDRGKTAITHYKTDEIFRLGDNNFISSITCTLETGRTHQVRVHMAHIGHPLLGDPVYGRKMAKPKNASEYLLTTLDTFKRQALHASVLGFKHPITAETMHFHAPLPKDMENLKKKLKQG